jgi:hypothetical protein
MAALQPGRNEGLIKMASAAEGTFSCGCGVLSPVIKS